MPDAHYRQEGNRPFHSVAPEHAIIKRHTCHAGFRFVDYYELLQISPNADLETTNRVQ